jgi:putative nucleotidyltransferase with HDIG domain
MATLFDIPREIAQIAYVLEGAGYEAYLVGGCVRDLLRNKKPKDWDITTSATPEQIMSLFPKTFYENEYGTVGVVNEEIADDDTERKSLKIVEVTPYRKEGTYSNFRHPDSVEFSRALEDDLIRRDFTMNAIAYSVSSDEIVDPFLGTVDIEQHLIRAVGNPNERFQEDALRLLRAVRFSAELGFTIEESTIQAIRAKAYLLEHIAGERVRDEFSKLLLSARPMDAVVLAHKVGLLKYILPEVEIGIGCEQNGDHIYDVWEHNLRAMQHAADRNWSLTIRMAALLHDVAKPSTRKWAEEKKDWTFYGHDVVGGKITRKILERLRFPKQFIDDVSTLVRYHLFFSDIEKITLSAVRRIVANVGPEHVWDLMNVRACDRIGMGRPKETPYRLRKYHSMIEEAMRAPVSVGMLKINGEKIMATLQEQPSPRIGWILHALFDEVIECPELNTETYLEQRTLELSKISNEELKQKGEKGKAIKQIEEEKEVGEIRKKYGVK